MINFINIIQALGFLFPTAVNMNVTIFWDMTPYGLIPI
jgi:hypothetical protein